MPRQRNSPWARMVPRSDYALIYDEHDPEELRKFVQDRMGPSLDRKEFRTIQNCNRYQLINRLRKLDRDGLFPCFMDLPPELRVNVYEWLLVDPREANDDGTFKPRRGRWVNEWAHNRLHPAVLRTSKQIYKEAHLVLYRTNQFRAGITYLRANQYHGDAGRHSFPECALSVTHLGRNTSFYQPMPSTSPRWELELRKHFLRQPEVKMLRSLTHLTIDLNLVTPGLFEHDGYVPKARRAVAYLCLSLIGASKLKELTISVKIGDPERSKVDFPRIL